MSEQQYRVIADRDKGDDMRPASEGERVTYGRNGWGQVVAVRIERPVPIRPLPVIVTDLFPDDEDHPEPSQRPSLPTRDQIAEAIYTARAGSNENWHKSAFREDYMVQADAVLALLQKGADR